LLPAIWRQAKSEWRRATQAHSKNEILRIRKSESMPQDDEYLDRDFAGDGGDREADASEKAV
jgi:hypothetical protein